MEPGLAPRPLLLKFFAVANQPRRVGFDKTTHSVRSSTMSTHQEDLDLLLSLQDRVLETPPGSPSNSHSLSPGYLSDDGSPRTRRKGQVDMSVFKNVVEDCLDYEPTPVNKNDKLKSSKKSKVPDLEKFSGLRIRNQLLSPSEISDRFSDVRFVRLPTIKNVMAGDTLSGCWATIGILYEKGDPKTSSIGQKYSVWKMGCLDNNVISLFLFGDAYQQNWKEQAGTVFGLFNCSARKDAMGSGFSLSVSSSRQILKMGISVDFGICKGKRKDGLSCTSIVNKHKGIYCNYHASNTSEKFYTNRTELKGGNLRTAFRPSLRSEGIYMVDPVAGKNNSVQPTKILSVEGLRKALSRADKVTTNTHSQGIRFLTEITGKTSTKHAHKESALLSQHKGSSEKRKSVNMNHEPYVGSRKQQPDAKRTKNDQDLDLADKSKQNTGRMIELDICSSDEEY